MSERDKLVARLWASGPTPSILAVREAASMLERDGVRIAELEAENAKARDREQQFRRALRYYAGGYHFGRCDPDAWDTVSGEPPNFWCDEHGLAIIEDGTLAARTLRGAPIEWTDGGGVDLTLAPIEGEAE